MSEHIRGSYDDALYKSTFTLLYFTLYSAIIKTGNKIGIFQDVQISVSVSCSSVFERLHMQFFTDFSQNFACAIEIWFLGAYCVQFIP